MQYSYVLFLNHFLKDAYLRNGNINYWLFHLVQIECCLKYQSWWGYWFPNNSYWYCLHIVDVYHRCGWEDKIICEMENWKCWITRNCKNELWQWEYVMESYRITIQLRSNGNRIIFANCDKQKLKWWYFTEICFSTFQSELHMIDIVLYQNKQNPNKHDPVTE